MEGDGEGLVAIVRGLDTSGVTLTVCNGARHNSDRRRSSRTRIQINAGNTRPADMPATDQRSKTLPANSSTLANQRSSVETSTGTDFARQHTSSQICDGRYASSYKLAHCMVTPTSPPEAVSEFPPQRKEPCCNEGNFEIGGHSSGKVRVSSSRVRHYGGSQTWGDKGSSHRYCKSNRDIEAFAYSLRKYPSMAPFRTASTDLIEKLIRYTQAKNFQEMSRSSKSMRSLRQQKSSDTYEMARASKHQQTYTRRQDNNAVNNSNERVGYRGRDRNFKLYSPMSDSRNHKENRHRETTCSTSYEYLKAGLSPYGRPNHSDESPSPVGSSSPERTRSPERSRSPDRLKSPEVSRSPARFKSIVGFKNAAGFRSPDRPYRPDRPIRVECFVRDLSLSDMSKYIRSTIRQICNERPVVFQVCPKLKNRYNQHKKVCPNKIDRASDVAENEPEEDQDQASGSVISRLIQSFNGCAIPSTEQAGYLCTRTGCYCTKATQCVNNPDASTSTHSACSCKIPTKMGCCRGMPCACASKSQDQAYYNKRIDEEIAEWLKDVPVHSIEGSESKKKRDTAIKELRKTLKQLPDDENHDENARNDIKSFIEDFPLWNPGKDRKDEKLFKNQLADNLTERILSVKRKPDRFRDIVKKWVGNMDFEDDGEEVDKETIIDKFVNKLKSMAVDRPACDVKYTHALRKEIIELLVDLALKFDGNMVKLKKMANQLAIEIVSIPRNFNLSGDTTDLTDEFEENVSNWICDHGLCGELIKDTKLIEGLARKLNKLKSQGTDDECVVEKMKEEIHQFVDDVGIAIGTIDELIDELVKQLSITVQTKEMEKLDQDELTEVFTDWLRNLPGTFDLHPRKLEKIIKELGKVIIEGRERGNENLANDILNYLVDADLGIYPADFNIHVEKLMKKLNLLPSNKYHIEQIKKAMIKDIFEIIENLSVSQGKKKELRNKVHQIVENHLLRSSLNSKESHDDMKDAIMEDMDDAISGIDIPKESRLKLKASLGNILNSNVEKSFMRLRRLSREGSDLKQIIAKDVRNAVKELPIDTDKKKYLMQKVKGTLSKNMHKPLPSNVKNTIDDEISNIVEKCPISEDNSILGSLKKMLSAVASKHLNIYLPKCVCDIQDQVEKDVGIVIDRSSIGKGKKKDLKKSIQDILTENEDLQLSDEVLRTIKEDISGVVSDLSIPQDKKDVLKKTVAETISKDFNEALSNLRYDFNKIRNKLFDDICNIIEKSTISRDVKKHLKNKLKSVLARNLDSFLSDEEKDTILDDVSNIVKEDMPKEKIRSLTNKLAKKLDTQQRKEDANEIDQLTKNLKELQNKILEYILREMEQAVEEAPIQRENKKELKMKLNEMSTVDYTKPAEDIAKALIDGINEILDELNLPIDKKNELKCELAAAIDEYSKLLRELKYVGPEYIQLKRRSSTGANGKHKKNGNGLMPIEEFDEAKAKENILQGIGDIIEESAIPKEKKIELKMKLKKMAFDHLKKPLSDDVLDAIKSSIADILDELQAHTPEKNKLKRALIDMTNNYLDNLREAKRLIEEVDCAKAKENILQGIEDIIEESVIPEEKKMELKRKLKKMATDNLEKPFSDAVQDAIKTGIADILDELQAPTPEKNQLKHALIDLTDDYLDNLQKAKGPLEKVDEKKAKESILHGIEDNIEESAIPEENNLELKTKLKQKAADNLKKPLSNDVQDAIKIDIADTLDELEIPKPKNDKLKRALTNMAEENVANLLGVDKAKAKESILQGMEKIIAESAFSEEKKMELKRKLKEMATDNLKKPFSDNVQDSIKIGIIDILDELQIPKPDKNKLKSALMNMTDDYLDNLRALKQPVKEVDQTKTNMVDDSVEDFRDTKQVQPLKGLMPIEEIYETKAREGILQGIEKIIEDSAITEEKKMELKRKLKKMATDNLEKPFSDDIEDAIKIGMADILDELQIPELEKNKLKRALINMANENLADLRGVTPKLPKRKKMTETQKNMLLGLETAIDEAPIPIRKKKELKEKLRDLAAKNLQTSSSDFQESLKDGIHEIIRQSNSPKATKTPYAKTKSDASDSKMKGTRSPVSQKPLKSLMPIEEVDETNAKESNLQRIDKITEESAIPENKKMELKRKLKKMATVNLKKSFSDDVQDVIKIGIADILDELQVPSSEKNKLKRALLNMVDENVDNIRGLALELSTLKEVENDTQNNILLGFEKAMDEVPIPVNKKKELKKKLKDMAAKKIQKSLSDDTAEALKENIDEILDELNLPRDDKNKLKSELTTAVDENLSNFKNEINLAKSMPDAKRNELNIIIGRVLPQFEEAVDPSYQKQLAEEFDELLEIALTDGDFKDARRKLIMKLMREQNVSEKEASTPVDELIGRAREMALKEERYELDPSYVKTLEADINDLVGIALVGGDFDDARRKLTKELMREQNLPEEKASSCADDLIGKAQKLALAAQAKDKSLLHKEALAKAISNTVDKSTMSKPDKSDLKNKLLSKLKQHIDKETYINKTYLEPLKSEVLKDFKKIIDESLIPPVNKNELKSLLNEDLAKTDDEIMNHYDVEEGYTKDYTKALSKVVNKSPMRNLEKSYLKKELAKTFEGILDDPDVDKKPKHNKAFTKAVNDAVDQSALSKPDQKSLKNKLLNKIEQTVDDSPNINDTGALKAEVLKDCKNLVDDSSIPMGQKNGLKILLKEEITDDYDDEEMEDSPEYDGKISEYKEAFAKAINEAVSKSLDMDDYDEKAMEDKLKKYKDAFARAINHAVDQCTLSIPEKNSKKDKLLSKLNQTIDNSPNLNDIGALTAEVLKDSKIVVDVSSLPADEKKELKLLLEQAMEKASKELMDDEEISEESFAMLKDKIAGTVNTWMDNLPIDLDPEVETAVANDIASDILDRQKYLQVHPEAVSSDKDETENLKYQIFRRMKNLVDPKDISPIMDGTEELYRMLMDLEPASPKFGLKGLVDHYCRG